MREDFPFFRSFEVRAEKVAGDVRVLAEVADSGACVAAKDISMAGLVGSLAMLLEHGRFGVTVDLDRLPRPVDVPLERWLGCFPSFGFLLCVPPGAGGRMHPPVPATRPESRGRRRDRYQRPGRVAPGPRPRHGYRSLDNRSHRPAPRLTKIAQ